MDSLLISKPFIAQVNNIELIALCTLPKHEILAILRDALWLAVLLRHVLIGDPIAKNTRLSVYIQLAVINTEAEYVVDASQMLIDGIELVRRMPPVQIDTPLMQVRKDHYLTSC
jgi:hypothetical protein